MEEGENLVLTEDQKKIFDSIETFEDYHLLDSLPIEVLQKLFSKILIHNDKEKPIIKLFDNGTNEKIGNLDTIKLEIFWKSEVSFTLYNYSKFFRNVIIKINKIPKNNYDELNDFYNLGFFIRSLLRPIDYLNTNVLLQFGHSSYPNILKINYSICNLGFNFQNVKCLIIIDDHNNRDEFKTFEPNRFKFNKLENFSMENFRNLKINFEFWESINLKYLYLKSSKKISLINFKQSNLKNIDNLNLISREIDHINFKDNVSFLNNLNEITNLKKLVIDGNIFEHNKLVPFDSRYLGKLTNLDCLKILNGSIINIKSIQDLKKLKVLRIKRNKILDKNFTNDQEIIMEIQKLLDIQNFVIKKNRFIRKDF